MTSLLRPENVIHVKYIIAIFVIESIILDALTRFCEDSARVSGRFIFEARVTYAISGRQMACKSLKRLNTELISRLFLRCYRRLDLR